ncbi:hypothetical protein GCM10025873_08500 [Demequina sediminis]|nr:hypothetical protein GCM10025873_08500 [Demequina sediminis]
MIEGDRPVVDTQQAALVSVVARRDAGEVLAMLVAQGHQDRVHAVTLAVHDELAEHGRHVPVARRVADVRLGRRAVRGVHLDLVGLREVGERGLEARDVGPVPEFGHREAPEEFHAGDAGQERVVVPCGPEVGHRAPEQSELDSRLDRHRQVAVREGLERHHGRQGVGVRPGAFGHSR